MSKEFVKYLYFNLSGVYNGKKPFIDLTDIPGTNCYCDDTAKAEIMHRIDSFDVPLVRFIDSGNYHYMSLFFMRKITVPYTLLLLDNHPDTKPAAFGGITSCGGWVREASESFSNLECIIMAGVDETLLEEESPLPEKAVSASLSEVPSLLKTINTPLYISLDKDIMSEEYARTDWSQGPYSLDEIINVLKAAFDTNKVIGFDICGEKKEDPTAEDIHINEITNKELLSAIYQKSLEII